MKILGIDPGYGILGWSIIDSRLRVEEYGAIRTASEEPIDHRLGAIYRELTDIIAKYKPDLAAVERLFFSKNTATAMDVAKTMGVILLVLNQTGLSYREYAPVQVKKAVTGYGRAAKEQMQVMVARIFGLKAIPRPDDAADALAVAACHALSCGNAVPF